MKLETQKAIEFVVTDWSTVDYVDGVNSPVRGILPINRPDLLANKGVHGLSNVQIGDKHYLLDESAEGTQFHLERIEAEPTEFVRKGTFRVLDRTQGDLVNPCGQPIPEVSKEHAQELKCEYCGTSFPSQEEARDVIETGKKRVTNREMLIASGQGSAEEIREKLIKMLQEEPSALPQLDEAWDTLITQVNEGIIPGATELVKKVLPTAMHPAIDQVASQANSLSSLLQTDLLTGYRANLIATMLTSPSLTGEALSKLLQKVPGLEKLGFAESTSSVRLYGPFREEDIRDGRIVAVVGENGQKQAMEQVRVDLPESTPKFKLPEVPQDTRMAFHVLDDRVYNKGVYGAMRLIDENNNPVGLDMMFALSANEPNGHPLNLIIPRSQLGQWDLRAPNGASLNRIIGKQGGKVIIQGVGGEVTREYPFGTVSFGKMHKLDDGRPRRFEFERLGTKYNEEATEVVVLWQEGMKIVRAGEIEDINPTYFPEKKPVEKKAGEVKDGQRIPTKSARKLMDYSYEERLVSADVLTASIGGAVLGSRMETEFGRVGQVWWEDDSYYRYPLFDGDKMASESRGFQIGEFKILEATLFNVLGREREEEIADTRRNDPVWPVYVMRMESGQVLLAGSPQVMRAIEGLLQRFELPAEHEFARHIDSVADVWCTPIPGNDRTKMQFGWLPKEGIRGITIRNPEGR